MRRFRRDDEGVAMIVVVTLGMVTMLLLTVIFTRSISDQNQVSQQRLFEQAIHVSEAGVDDALYRLRSDINYVTKNSDNLTPDASPLPAFVPNSPEEEAFVRSQVADNPVVRTGPGEWATYKPAGNQVVFAVGWVPNRANPVRTRLVRAEYDFAPFSPDAAIISNGDLKFSGRVTVTGTVGSVHANGSIDQSGAPATFNGYLSAGGTYNVNPGSYIGQPPPISGADKPHRELPNMNPRELYHLSEFDLCTDGTVRPGPAHPSGTPVSPGQGVPCSSTVILASTAGGGNVPAYRGWKVAQEGNDNRRRWDYSGDGSTAQAGVYYAYRANMNVNGGWPAANVWRTLLLSESLVPIPGSEPDCPHKRGSIIFGGHPRMTAFDPSKNILMIAGRDVSLSGTGGNSLYQGLIGVHEQFSVSGNVEVNGSVIINTHCDTTGGGDGSEVSPPGPPTLNGTVVVKYDGFPYPLGNEIRITRWQEL